MAVYTELSSRDAHRLAEAHGLGRVKRVVPIPAGSVNSNFFLDTEAGQRVFARIYEEQDVDGVAYEWALLDHLHAAGLPVPRRFPGPGPGEIRVAGKPTGVFEQVEGRESCQRAVTPERAQAVGQTLARCHRAGRDFEWRRAGRFRLTDIRRRLDDMTPPESRSELIDAKAFLRKALDEVEGEWPTELPVGVIHGDLFRDNVRWEDDRVVAIIDWESASDGLLVFDLMVCVLAWCFGDEMEWELARALIRGYAGERPLLDTEVGALRLVGMGAAVRFAVTRITDFELREGAVGERTYKDYRRFLARLDILASMSAAGLAERLL